MRSSNETALFKNQQAIIETVQKSSSISSVSLYKPIMERWDQDSCSLYFLVSIHAKYLNSDEEVDSIINTFKDEVEKILETPFGIFLYTSMEQQLIRQRDGSQIKREMEERLAYSIPLEELTDEPWLAQFERKKAVVSQKRSPDSNFSSRAEIKDENELLVNEEKGNKNKTIVSPNSSPEKSDGSPSHHYPKLFDKHKNKRKAMGPKEDSGIIIHEQQEPKKWRVVLSGGE
jgi:hypothetical protein